MFHPVILTPKKLTIDTKYYLLQLNHDTLTKEMEFESADFFFVTKGFKSKKYGDIPGKILSYEELQKKVNQLREVNGEITDVCPIQYRLKTDYDLHSFSVYGHFILNEFLKTALEQSLPGQMQFRSAQLLNIKMEEGAYQAKGHIHFHPSIESRVNALASADDLYYFSKKERLENNDALIQISGENGDPFLKKQIELNVIFPELFKKKFMDGKLKIRRITCLMLMIFTLITNLRPIPGNL